MNCNEHIIDHIVKSLSSTSSPRLRFLAISGQGGVGKSTLSKVLAERLSAPIIELDHYRLPRSLRSEGVYGSCPRGNDLERLKEDLNCLRRGEGIIPPFFERESGNVVDGSPIESSPICIFDGEVATFNECIELFDFHIYIESDWRTQLNTRLTRDIEERGMDLKKVLSIFMKSNLEDHPTYCSRGRDVADVLLYCNDNFQFELRK